jgi:hypothetical protein
MLPDVGEQLMTLDPSLRDQLIEEARKVSDERGWTWREPVEVTAAADRGEPVWVVRTNVLMRSPSVRIVLRKSDRSVVHAGSLPR